MSDVLLSVGGVEVPLCAALELTQTYEVIGGSAVMRMASGAAVKQSHWRRLRTTISGAGWVPPGLDGIDFDAAVVLKCTAPLSMSSASNVIVIPAARRSDTAPFGFAHLPGGERRETPVSMSTDTATLTAVGGAVGYSVCWYPQLNVYAQAPTQTADPARGSVSWELVAEEV